MATRPSSLTAIGNIYDKAIPYRTIPIKCLREIVAKTCSCQGDGTQAAERVSAFCFLADSDI